MTTFTFISNALVAVGAKPFATTVQAFRDNILSGLEADASAPVNQTHWHPYNKVTNGDANNGLIYNFTTSGAVAFVDSPDFTDGYEYRFIIDRISGTAASVTLGIALYRETDGAFGTSMPMLDSGTGGNSKDYSGQVVVNRPRRVQNGCVVDWGFGLTSTVGSGESNFGGAVCSRAAQKRLRARFAWASGNIDAGNIYMERRRYIG